MLDITNFNLPYTVPTIASYNTKTNMKYVNCLYRLATNSYRIMLDVAHRLFSYHNINQTFMLAFLLLLLTSRFPAAFSICAMLG